MNTSKSTSANTSKDTSKTTKKDGGKNTSKSTRETDTREKEVNADKDDAENKNEDDVEGDSLPFVEELTKLSPEIPLKVLSIATVMNLCMYLAEKTDYFIDTPGVTSHITLHHPLIYEGFQCYQDDEKKEAHLFFVLKDGCKTLDFSSDDFKNKKEFRENQTWIKEVATKDIYEIFEKKIKKKSGPKA